MTTDCRKKAYSILRNWKSGSYVFGVDCIGETGRLTACFGKNVLVVANTGHTRDTVEAVLSSLKKENLTILSDGPIPGARSNSPKDDAYRIAEAIARFRPDCIVAVGGGSTIDSCKAATVIAASGQEIDAFLGNGKVSEYLKQTGKTLVPLIAEQTAASSGSHLTKYANITYTEVGQKKLIVDPAVVPVRQLFDYRTTCSMPPSVTVDGALDALAHTIESFWGASEDKYDKLMEICITAVPLVLGFAKKAIENPDDIEAREALGLATDLGGYAIMVGGTSGGHLTSFSLVDCVSHGTACGLMNPYYGVFYSKAIQPQMHILYDQFKEYGFISGNEAEPEGRALSTAVAQAMMDFSASIGAPVRLTDIPSFKQEIHIPRALAAAKDPDLKMKLLNMPVPLSADDIDPYMGPILMAACSGDLSMIKEMV